MTTLLSLKESERTQIGSASMPGQLDLESRAWVDALGATGVEHARALERLHDLLLRAAYTEANRRQHLYA